MFIAILPLTAKGKTGLPREFDNMVPLYPGAQVMDVRYSRNSVTVTFTSTDSLEMVFEFYSPTLQERGWRHHVAANTNADGKQLQYTKGNVHLILSARPGRPDTASGFVIHLEYPGGRE